MEKCQMNIAVSSDKDAELTTEHLKAYSFSEQLFMNVLPEFNSVTLQLMCLFIS